MHDLHGALKELSDHVRAGCRPYLPASVAAPFPEFRNLTKRPLHCISVAPLVELDRRRLVTLWLADLDCARLGELLGLGEHRGGVLVGKEVTPTDLPGFGHPPLARDRHQHMRILAQPGQPDRLAEVVGGELVLEGRLDYRDDGVARRLAGLQGGPGELGGDLGRAVGRGKAAERCGPRRGNLGLDEVHRQPQLPLLGLLNRRHLVLNQLLLIGQLQRIWQPAEVAMEVGAANDASRNLGLSLLHTVEFDRAHIRLPQQAQRHLVLVRARAHGRRQPHLLGDGVGRVLILTLPQRLIVQRKEALMLRVERHLGRVAEVFRAVEVVGLPRRVCGAQVGVDDVEQLQVGRAHLGEIILDRLRHQTATRKETGEVGYTGDRRVSGLGSCALDSGAEAHDEHVRLGIPALDLQSGVGWEDDTLLVGVLREPAQVGATVDHAHLNLHHARGSLLVPRLGVSHRHLAIRRARHEGKLDAAVSLATPELGGQHATSEATVDGLRLGEAAQLDDGAVDAVQRGDISAVAAELLHILKQYLARVGPPEFAEPAQHRIVLHEHWPRVEARSLELLHAQLADLLLLELLVACV
eukprot:scaffold12435_cov69-Phaeocystis_antarctica.AAC.5